MTNYVKYGLIAAAIVVIYLAGYNRAETEGELAIESLKRAHAQAIVDAQNEQKEKYEKEIAGLVARLNDLGAEHADRLRELEQFRASRGDVETCYRERDDLASLCVRGEQLLKRAVTYLGVQQ